MAVQICVDDGCERPVYGSGYWAGGRGHENPHPPRPRRCRTHYLDSAAAEFVKFKVTGRAKLTDARTNVSMSAPAVIELDPVATNIAFLVASGFGERVQPAKPVKAG